MSRIFCRALAAWAAALLLAVPVGALAATVTLLHVNDSHSHLDAVGPKDRHLDGTLGGLSKAATVIAAQKAANPSALFVHGGDFFQGDSYFNVTYGVAELQLLASLGLDAMVVGNHELHLGPELFTAVLAQAFPGGGGPPLLAANFDLSGFPPLQSFVTSDVVKTVDGVKVGLFGLTTPYDGANQPDPVIIRDDFAGIASDEVQHLRVDLGAEVVILLSHLGMEIDQQLAASVPGLDAIIGAHDHLALTQAVMVAGPGGKQVPIVSAGKYYQGVGKLSLSVAGGQVSLAGYELIPVNGNVPRLPPVAAVVGQLQSLVNATFGTEMFHTAVAYALLDVSESPGPVACLRDTGVGNLVTDALRFAGGTDLGIEVDGFLPDGIARGFVVGNDLFRTVGDGFDPASVAAGQPSVGYPLFTFDITGEQLLQALAATVAIGGDFFVEISGMTYTFDSRKAPFEQLVSAFVHGKPVDPARTYSATVSLGVLAGMEPLGIQVTNVRPLGRDQFAAVRDWAARLRILVYTQQGRIRDRGISCWSFKFAPAMLGAARVSASPSSVAQPARPARAMRPRW